MKRQTIGVVAGKAGVSVETIRFYERKGLIEKPQAISTTFREYPPGIVDRILFIKSAQALGFTLSEIAELLGLTKLESNSRSEVKFLAQDKLSSIRKKIESLQQIEATLENLVHQCSGQGSIVGCPIIEAISSSHNSQ